MQTAAKIMHYKDKLHDTVVGLIFILVAVVAVIMTIALSQARRAEADAEALQRNRTQYAVYCKIHPELKLGYNDWMVAKNGGFLPK